ncbi:MAG: hypothetical protein E7287_07545 [Lachnospiraceae bacterium]|nr:hypothetical protein [Lachnospiraceae bacterium]
MMKRKVFLCMLCAALTMTACGTKENQESEQKEIFTLESEKVQTDYSGTYTDKMGTEDIYSELALEKQQDGTYAFTMGIYRVTTLEGTATGADGIFHFVSDAPCVEGDITIDGEVAEVIITASAFEYIAVGDEYRFPDGRE